jgi:hypothetical protein
MLFHSLGNLYMKKLIKQNLQSGLPESLFDNIILNAAAVNQENHKEWVEKLRIQDQLYITCNKQDFNLKGVRIFTSDGKQLGEKIKSPLAINATYIQFNKSVGFRFPTGQTHTYFIGKIPAVNNNVKACYYDLFHGSNPNLGNENKFMTRKDGLGYEILPN